MNIHPPRLTAFPAAHLRLFSLRKRHVRAKTNSFDQPQVSFTDGHIHYVKHSFPFSGEISASSPSKKMIFTFVVCVTGCRLQEVPQ